MIVYGDPQFSVASGCLLAHLKASAANATSDLDHLRTLLVQAGQFEQAMADAGGFAEQHARQLTDRSADAFYVAYSSQDAELPPPHPAQRRTLAELQPAFQKVPCNLAITAKLPEGYEFYSLYPEQYCRAALAWHLDHASMANRSVLIVGLRSIGTSLSAIVATTLRAAGWQTARLTVRPAGHPFRRVVGFPSLSPSLFSRAILVDEGPGLSGSSLKAAFGALEELGFRNISILPGHVGGFGTAATPETRAWWRTVPLYHVPLGKVRWNDQTLVESLTKRSSALANGEPIEKSIDLSAGGWRRFVFDREADWPPVAAAFERQKILCRSRNLSVLWKFSGFRCISYLDELEPTKSRGSSNVVQRPIGHFRGFTAFPWIEGNALTRADADDPATVSLIARHIVSTAQFNISDHGKPVERLTRMLQVNASEAFGETVAPRIQRLLELTEYESNLPNYGDGHLAPCEWIRDTNGLIWKTDATGHAVDHTIVGPQSLLWDIAGVLIEWDLDETAADLLLDFVRERYPAAELRALDFYRAAYAAFRMGLFRSVVTTNRAEKRRLDRAVAYYGSKLIGILKLTGSNE